MQEPQRLLRHWGPHHARWSGQDGSRPDDAFAETTGIHQMHDAPLTAESYRLANSVGYLMARCSRAAIARAEAAFGSDSEVSFAELLVLVMLRDGFASTPGGLVEMLGYNSGAVTRLIDRLEDNELVERVRRPRDRRSIDLELTPTGRGKITTLLPRLADVWNQILRDFEPGEYETLVGLLKKLHGALETMR